MRDTIRTTTNSAALTLRIIAFCFFIALLIVVATSGEGPSEREPVKATREVEARHEEEAQSRAYEEEQREAQYAATPGPPAPVEGWQP